MIDYAFGAGGFKLGERVEILTTGQRGILISEMVHISGCNTYDVSLPNSLIDGKAKTTTRDHLLLRRLEPSESMFDVYKELSEENSFTPKGTDVNAEWIRAAVNDKKEYVPEIDDAVGVEEITILPGMEVWNKTVGKTMVVNFIFRDIFSKELYYGCFRMVGDKESYSVSRAYSLIPLEQKIVVPYAKKTGAVFEDGRDNIEFEIKSRFSEYRYSRT